MNPGTQSRLTPEIMEALMRRRAAGLGGGSTIPAQQQVMAPNNMGGPTGQWQTPLPTSPQAVPSGNIPQSSGSSPAMPGAGDPSQQAAGTSSGQGQGRGANPDVALMKALLQRLVAGL